MNDKLQLRACPPLIAKLDSTVPRTTRQGEHDAHAIHNAHRHVPQKRTHDNGQALLEIGADGQGECARNLVRFEGNNVERKGKHAVAGHDRHLPAAKIALGDEL